jgi:hypothetical protein
MSDGTAVDTSGGVSLGGTGTADGQGSAGNSGSSAGAGTGTPPNGSDAGNGQAAAWYGTVEDADLKGLAEQKGWKSPTDVLKSYKELETAFSSKGGTLAKPPAKPDEYKFNAPTDLPKESGYNDQFASWYKTAAHKAGLTQEAAAALHDEFVGFAKSSLEGAGSAQAEQFAQSVQSAERELTTDWGAKGTPTFDRNIEMAKRAIRMSDPKLMDALKQVGAIGDVNGQPVVMNATIVKAFAAMGAGMYAEDRLYGQPASDKNPFDDATTDLAMQGRLIKEDPDKAASLIHAAGKGRMFSQFLERHARPRK